MTSHNEKKIEYTLPDGSKVYLNSNSQNTFPLRFSSKARTVELQGEGYFEVTHDSNRPFTVTTPSGLSVKVLGTKFNVEAFAGDSIM